jgi:hypothetical protein
LLRSKEVRCKQKYRDASKNGHRGRNKISWRAERWHLGRKQTIMPQAQKQGGSIEINYLAAGAETG